MKFIDNLKSRFNKEASYVVEGNNGRKVVVETKSTFFGSSYTCTMTDASLGMTLTAKRSALFQNVLPDAERKAQAFVNKA